MRNRFGYVVVLLALVGNSASGSVQAAEPLGTIPEVELLDVAGNKVTTSQFRSRKAVVFAFLGLECPVANAYAPQMQRLADRFVQQDVAWVGVYSERGATRDAAAKHGDEYGLKFPRLLDTNQQLAAQAGVKRVPTFVVVAPSGAILYRGRIDDRWSPDGRRRDVPRTQDLIDAVEAIVAGKTPPNAETPVFGCPLSYKPAATK
ncbi:MAG: redoxin family protein [Planctomycetaceae bacterium]|nr:redoxin family protein [Planctomycetaceae bacterium]